MVVACKSAPPPEPEPALLEVFGEVQYFCRSGLRPAAGLQVDLHDREDPQVLGTTVTSSIGAFRIETEPLGFDGGRFALELGGAKVPISGSTRLSYRVAVRLPCLDEQDRVWPASVLSEVTVD
jgi:hypothetical protein